VLVSGSRVSRIAFYAVVSRELQDGKSSRVASWPAGNGLGDG
jgi:hypothetical protein